MMLRKALLFCGILSSLLYLATVALVPRLWWQDYSSSAQTVSELAAIGAPTKAIVDPLFTAYGLLMCLFGIGIWTAAHGKLALRVAGAVLVAKEVLSLLFSRPMHLREVIAAGGGGSSDTTHVAVVSIGLVLMLIALGCGAVSFGRRFKLYSAVTIIVFVASGVLTFMDAPRLEANLPTPWMGVWERICILAYMAWIAVLSLILLRGADEGSAPASH